MGLFNRSKTTSNLNSSSRSINGSRKGKNGGRQRSKSMPVYYSVKGVMRVLSLDDSLHNKGLKRKDSGEGEPVVKRSISFCEVQIREYERAVSDNPSVSSGPPIGIGWKYNPNTIAVPLESYEDTHPKRRSMQEMALPRKVREDMLKREWGVAQSELASAIRSTIKVKNQRRTTVQNLGKADKAEEMAEKAKKKLKVFKKSSTSQVELLMQKSKEAERSAKSVQAAADIAKNFSDETPEETPEATPDTSVAAASNAIKKITITATEDEHDF